MERRKCLVKSLKNELWNFAVDTHAFAPILLLTGQQMFHCGPVAEHDVLWTGT
jgi:hypothetical protein